MSIANLFIPNNLVLFCGTLNTNIINVINLEVTNLTVTGTATINNEIVTNSTITSATITNDTVANSTIANANITNETVANSNIVNLTTTGATVIGGSCLLSSNSASIDFGSPTSYGEILLCDVSGNYFSDSHVGDFILRETNYLTNNLLLGVGNGFTPSNLSLQNGVSVFNTPITLPSSGAVSPGLLNYYEVFSITTTYTGIWSSPQNVTLEFTRLGNMIMMSQINASIVGTTQTTSTFVSVTAMVPTRFLPPIEVRCPIIVSDNGTTAGVVDISASGNILIYPANSSGVFGGTGQGLIYAFGITYPNM
jgi:hypothetical protein